MRSFLMRCSSKKARMINRNTLVLVSLNPDRTDCSGNVYPEQGFIQSGMYFNNSNILHGLYGIAWGNYNTNKWLNVDEKAQWCVVRVDKSNEIYCLDEDESFVKFRSGSVVFSGKRADCEQYIDEKRPEHANMGFSRPSFVPATDEILL